MVTRALKGLTAGHYTFDPTKASVPFINAIGRGPLLDYHASRGALSLNLLAVGAPTCVCSTGIEGYISSDMNPGKQKFSKNCAKEPVGDLVAKHNPTCTIGQCKHPEPLPSPSRACTLRTCSRILAHTRCSWRRFCFHLLSASVASVVGKDEVVGLEQSAKGSLIPGRLPPFFRRCRRAPVLYQRQHPA